MHVCMLMFVCMCVHGVQICLHVYTCMSVCAQMHVYGHVYVLT